MQSEIHKQSANHSVQLRTCDIITLVQCTTYKGPDAYHLSSESRIAENNSVIEFNFYTKRHSIAAFNLT